MENSNNLPKKNTTLQLAIYLEIIYNRKWFLLLPIPIFTGLAAIIAFGLPPSYRSTTLILVEQQQISSSYVTPTDSTPIESRLNTIRQQIMSRTKLEQIIKQFNPYKKDKKKEAANFLSNFREKANNIFLKVMKKIGMEQKSQNKYDIEKMVEKMRDDINVKILGNNRRSGSAFSISFVGQNPYSTMQITNTIASMYIDENLKLREQYTEGTSEFLAAELDKAEQELKKQEKTLRAFKEKYMGYLPEQLDTNLRTLDRLQLELQSARNDLSASKDRGILLKARLRNVENRPLTEATNAYRNIPGVRAAPNPLLQELETLQVELSSLLSVYKDNYPDVIITKNRVKEIERLLATRKNTKTKTKTAEFTETVPVEPDIHDSDEIIELKSQIKTATAQTRLFKRRIARIKGQIKIYERRVEAIPANEQKLADILRNYNISNANYQSLLEKKLNARLAENLEKRQKGERFRIIDPANLPAKPFKPNKIKIIIMGAMLGLGLGGGLVFLLDFVLNPTFRRAEDFIGIIPIPVLATIPTFSEIPAQKSKKYFRKKEKKINE